MYNKVTLFLLLTYFTIKSVAEKFQNCSNIHGKNFAQLAGSWEVHHINGSQVTDIYFLNICDGLAAPSQCNNSAICKTSASSSNDAVSFGDFDKPPDIQASSPTSISFFLEYNTTSPCVIKGGVQFFYRSSITFECSKILGSPVVISSDDCSVDFLWETSLACLRSNYDATKEVRCYSYDSDGHRRDLESLVKRDGGYYVKSISLAPSSSDGLYINVCRDITTVAGDDMNSLLGNCPEGTAACLVQNGHSYNLGIPSESLNISTENRLVLKYLAPTDAPKPTGCGTPSVVITFVCPGKTRGGSKLPFITSSVNCQYEIEWWTEAACPSEFITSSTCGLNLEKHGVQLDLSSLQKDYHNRPYEIHTHDSQETVYSLNICGNTDTNCGSAREASAVCQIIDIQHQSHIAGVAEGYKLRYFDGQISLAYTGGDRCHNGVRRSSVILFHCNQTAGVGSPSFNHELHCTYYFDWFTSHACLPSPPTCQLTDERGQIYDLSPLTKEAGSGLENWQVLDGQQTGTRSGKKPRYFINVCNELLQNDDVTSSCSSSSSCSIDGNDVTSFGSFSNSTLTRQKNKLVLQYNGGSTCGSGKQKTTQILFYCRLGVLDSSPVLKYLSADGCNLVLTWHTAAACPLKNFKGTNCVVSDEDSGLKFDLRRLRKTGKDMYKVTTGQYDYYLNVCDELTNTPCDDHLRHTSACQLELNGQQRKYVTGEKSESLTYYNGFIKLVYENGDSYSSHLRNRSTQISFLCDTKAGAGHPQFLKEKNAYVFNWYTSYVCPAVSTQCMVTDVRTGDQYDLSSLSKSEDQEDVNWSLMGEEITGQPKRKYYLNVCRPVNELQTLNNSDHGCDALAGACETIVTSDGKEETSVADLGRPINGPQIESKNHLLLSYTGGSTCVENDIKKNFTTHIHFVCQKGALSSSPRFLKRSACSVSFEWYTEAACLLETTESDSGRCEVKSHNSEHIFNLQPLQRMSNESYVVENDHYRYELNVCGSAEDCQNMDYSYVFACRRDVATTNVTHRMINSSISYSDDGNLVMEYTTNERNQYERFPKYIITFVCNRTALASKPVLTNVDEDIVRFDFPTSLACQPSSVDCLVTDKFGNQYDLSPLSNSQQAWTFIDEHTSFQYYISVCRPLPPTSGCQDGSSGACRTHNVTGNHIEGNNLGLVQSSPVVEAAGVILSYVGGDICQSNTKKRYSTRILFQCSDRRSHAPVLQSNPADPCEITFVWQTPVACPIKKVTTKSGQSCAVTEPLYQMTFDLSSLSRNTDYLVTTGGEWDYNLNICGKLHQATGNCKDSGACQIHHDDPSTTMHDAGKVSTNLTYEDGVVTLTYLHGERCHANKYERSSTIRFLCQHSDNLMPTFINETADCRYMFDWPTSKVCPPVREVECSIKDQGGNKYDLSSLSSTNQNYIAAMKSKSGTFTFYINVCRSLLHKPGQTCPPNSAACMKNEKNKFFSLGEVASGPVVVDNKLQIVYSNGDRCRTNSARNYTTTITFQCDHNAPINSQPVVTDDESSCHIQMLWVTRAACPVADVASNVSHCAAVNYKTKHLFNLSSLASDTQYEVRADDGRLFHINVCQKVTDGNCPDGAGTCITKNGKHVSGGLVSDDLEYKDGALFLRYVNGDVCEADNTLRYSTVISFVCHRSTALALGEPTSAASKPVFVDFKDQSCTLTFSWHTHAACELQQPCAVLDSSSSVPHFIDLTPLISESGHYTAVSDVAGTQASYFINVCRPLEPISGVVCPPGSAVCEITSNHEVKTLGFVGPDENFLSYNSESREVTLLYKTSRICSTNSNANVSTRIVFSCLAGATPRSTSPRLISINSDCMYLFEWGTEILCNAAGSTSASKPAQSPGCSYTDSVSGKTYILSDLHPISIRDHNGEFKISPCHNLEASDGECKDAGACFISNNGQKVSLGAASSRIIDGTSEFPVKMKFTNGSRCPASNGKREVSILFRCDRTVNIDNKASVTYDEREQCRYTVYWPTSYVCPRSSMSCTTADINTGSTYDLSLLSSLTRAWRLKDDVGNSYYLNLCRPVRPMWKDCDKNATVSIKQKGLEKLRTLGVLWSQSIVIASPTTLIVSYKGGEQGLCKDPEKFASTEIRLECDPKITGSPQFSSLDQEDCIYHFTWKSRVACHDKPQGVVPDASGKFVDPKSGAVVDLSSLLNERTWIAQGDMRQDDDGTSTYLYAISLEGNLDTSRLPPAVRAICGSGTAVCQYKTSGFARKVAETTLSPTYVMTDDVLEISFTSNDDCGKDKTKKSHVIISLECSYYSKLGEQPTFVYESNECGYIFHWSTKVLCTNVNVTDQGSSDTEITNHLPSAVDANTHEVKERHSQTTAIVLSLLGILGILIMIFVAFRNGERRKAFAASARRTVCSPCLGNDGARYRYVRADTMDDEEGTSLFENDFLQEETSLLGPASRLRGSGLPSELSTFGGAMMDNDGDLFDLPDVQVKLKSKKKTSKNSAKSSSKRLNSEGSNTNPFDERADQGLLSNIKDRAPGVGSEIFSSYHDDDDDDMLDA